MRVKPLDSVQDRPNRERDDRSVATESGRAYSSPRLFAYGDIRQMTGALFSTKGPPDGMVIGMMDLKTGGL